MTKVYANGAASIENLNVDVVNTLCEFMHKVAELNIQILVNSKYFNDIIMLFHDTLVSVNERETNNQLVLFFSYIISNRNA